MYTSQNTNLAYDMSLFDTDERTEKKIKERTEKPIQLVERSVAKSGSVVKTLVVGIIAVAVLFSLLYSKASLSEISSEISKDQTLLQEAQTENVRLQAALDNKVTLSKVEDYAVNVLGFQKITTSQEKYVTVNTESMTKIADDDDSNFFVGIKNWFSGVLEYLGL